MVKPAVKANIMLFASIIIMLIPTGVVLLIGWKSATSLAMLAAMGGLFSAIGLRGRGLLLFTAASGVSVFLASLVSENPVASAGLMLVCGAAFGAANKWGLSMWNFMFPVFAAAVIAEPPQLVNIPVPNALLTSAIVMGCIVAAALLTMIIVKEPKQTEIERFPARVNVMFAVNLAVLMTGAGYYASTFRHEQLGVWLTLTIVIVLIRPYGTESASRAIQRAAGTVIGFLIAIGVGASLLPDYLYYVAGFAFLEVALLMRISPVKKYWEYVMFLTPGVVLISGTPAEIGSVSNDRLLATALAAVAALLLLGLERLLFWRGGFAKAQDAVPSTASTH